MKPIVKAAGVFFLAVCLGFMAMGLANIRVLMLPDAERGVFFLGDGTAELEKLENGAYCLRFLKDPATGASVQSATSAQDVESVQESTAGTHGVTIERLLFGLQTDGQKPARLRAEVYRFETAEGNAAGQSRVDIITDLQPIQVGTEVLRLHADDVWQIMIVPEDGQEISISDLRIDNTVQKSPFVFLCGAFGGGALLLLLVFRAQLTGRPARSFLCVSLLIGLLFVLVLPRGKVGYDEETHLQAVVSMVGMPSGGLHISDAILTQLMVTEYNNPDAQPGAAAEMQEYDAAVNAAADYRDGSRTPEFAVLPNRMPAYAASAAAMWLGEQLGLPWTVILMLSRFANLLCYAALMTAAIARTPRGKYLLALIALFPENLFLASTFSYDPFVTGMLSLGFACLMRAFCGEDGAFDWKNAALMCIAFLLGCLPKAVYAPLLLCALAVPAKKIRTKREHRLFLCGMLLLVLLLLAVFILPTAVAPAETGDARGGATSEVSQVGYILGAPFSFALLLFSQMLSRFPQCFFGPDCTTYMGHLVSEKTAFRGYYGLYLFLLCAVVLPGIRLWRIKRAETMRRLFCFLMIGGACVLIWTSMYVAFTEPGAEVIAGVQGRYFIPLMFPLYLLLDGPAEDGSSPLGDGRGKSLRQLFKSAKLPETAALAAESMPKKSKESQENMVRALAGIGTVWYDLTILLAAAGLVLTAWTAIVARFGF